MKSHTDACSHAFGAAEQVLGTAILPIAERISEHLHYIVSDLRRRKEALTSMPSSGASAEYDGALQQHVRALGGHINFHQPISLALAESAALAAVEEIDGNLERCSR